MKITVICSNENHPVYPYILKWKEKNGSEHSIRIVNKSNEIKNTGDLLFLIGCTEIISKNLRKNFDKVLCVHESDLPHGKGWSPCVHLILNGYNKIPLTLFEINDKIDAGDIWKKTFFNLDGHELSDEVNHLVSIKTTELMDFALKKFNSISPIPQDKTTESFFPKRNPSDSELDINKSIVEQFNLLRVADKNRYPCFFYHHGYRYKVTIEKY
jgi:methionyl-tRNA formyltransferase